LKRLREKREQVIAALQSKINRQFYRCIFMERTLRVAVEETAAIQRMRIRLERGRERLAKMRERIAGMRIDPSNQQIAKLLGISKGTVDTTLHALKLQWNKKPKNTTLI
jgi:FixJ family two-component response regulator